MGHMNKDMFQIARSWMALVVTALAMLTWSAGTMTAQVKLQQNNVDEVLKAYTIDLMQGLTEAGLRFAAKSLTLQI